MSPGNQGVFQLLKEVTFRRILVFYDERKWGILWVLRARARLDGEIGPRNFT